MGAAAEADAAAARACDGPLADLVTNAQRYGRRTAVLRRWFGRWEPVSFERLLDDVRRCAKGLAAAGLQPGDRVGIWADDCYEWTVAAHAVWCAGAVVVPISAEASAEQVGQILLDSGAVALFAGPAAAPEPRAAAGSGTEAPSVRWTWVLGPQGIDALAAAGVQVGDDDLDGRTARTSATDPAVILYPVRDGLRPAGCEISHGALAHRTESLVGALPRILAPGAVAMLAVGPWQAFGLLAQLACLRAGAPVAHLGAGRAAMPDLAAVRPTSLFAHPPDVEALHESLGSAARLARVGHSRGLAGAVLRLGGSARGAGIVSRARTAVFDLLVVDALRGLLGDRLEWVVTSGDGLTDQARRFFGRIGLPVIECYGLAESVGTIALTRPGRAGAEPDGLHLLPGAAFRIAADGEILLRSPSLFTGYFNDPISTRDRFDADGWLRTGDAGQAERHGSLRVLGRMDDIFITAAGREVWPGPIEQRLRGRGPIDRCLVLGEARPCIGALVTVGEAWQRRGPDDPALLAAVAREVAAVNRSLPRTGAVEAFAVVMGSWSRGGGELGPSGELQRTELVKRHGAAIEAMFG